MIISDINLRKTNQSPMPRSIEEKGVIPYDNNFSRIEELIRGNAFSREEISHLMEILDSRVENEWEKRKSSTHAGVDAQMVSGEHEIRKIPYNGKQIDNDRTTVGPSREKFDVPTGVSASPIDIARAYMAGRTFEGSHDFYNAKPSGERAQPSNEFARKPLLPPPSPKPSVCWPGAMVHDHHGYTTPQRQGGRSVLHDFPRTPYSRTILSKSKTKVKSKGETVDGYGSVGPIRRIKNKFSSEVRPRGSIFSPAKDERSKMVKPAFGGFLPSAEKTTKVGDTSGASEYRSGDNISDLSYRGISNPSLSSSQAVSKILEHLDRNKPTPKEKEAELKLVIAWRKSSPEATNASYDENVSSVQVEEPASHKNANMASADSFVEFNRSSSQSNSFVRFPDKGMNEAKGAVSGNAKASGSAFSDPDIIPGANALLSFGLKDVKMVAGTTGSELSKNNGNKPSLPSISVNKPDLYTISSEYGPGFTFPVSASSGVLSEPPTPSMTPSSSASALSRPIRLPTIHSYPFGTKSTPPLVFAFPPSTSTSTQDDSHLKFSFGSDKKTRLSFSSFGTDAICY